MLLICAVDMRYLMTACLSGAANLRRNSVARKNSVRASAVEIKSTTLRGPSATGARWLILLTFFFFFYAIITSTERGASAVEILGSPRY